MHRLEVLGSASSRQSAHSMKLVKLSNFKGVEGRAPLYGSGQVCEKREAISDPRYP